MDKAAWQPRDDTRDAFRIHICPNAILGFGVFLALVFVSYQGRSGVLIFLVMGMLLVMRRVDFALRDIREYWWLCLLPLWAIVSAMWSEHHSLSLRHGTQLLITFVIAISLANRLSPVLLLRMLFFALLIAGVASLLIGEVRADGIWIGIFESKNYYAFTMVTLVLSSFAFVVDHRQSLYWRLAGLAGLALGLPQMVMAESVGAMIASIVVFVVAVILLRTSSLPPARRQASFVALLCLTLAGVLAAFYFWNAITELLFEVTGKDPSLTGRTDLWTIALAEIARAPLLGTGYRAFWVEGNSAAEALWTEYYIGSRSGFNFHNLYLSNAVEIGVVGVAAQVLLLASAFLLCVRWLVQTGGAPAMFFFMVVSFVIVLSFVEVPVFFEFDTLSVVTLASLVYGLRAAREVPQLLRFQSAAWPG